MRLFKNLTLMSAMFFCVLLSNRVNAGILWEKELILDANTNSAPLDSCLNKDGNGIIVMTVESPKGSFPIKGDNILWEIGADGNSTRILPKNNDGSKVWTNAKPAGVGSGCAITSDNLGNLLTVGILSKQKGEKGQKVATISKTYKAEQIMTPRTSIESHSVKKMIRLQDNTFVLVGDKDNDALLLRFDKQGNTIHKELFDVGQTEKFSGVDQIEPDNSNLAVVGISANLSKKNDVENFAENFIVIYDSNYKIVYEDYFARCTSVSMFSLTLQPKVCCLENGNMVVLYRKESADPNKTLLWTRCYTQELKVIWEKEIFAADKAPEKLPFFFDVALNGSKGFVVAIIKSLTGLEFYSFSEAGSKTSYAEYKSMVDASGFNLMQINNRTIAVLKEGTVGNIKECTIRAKVIALE
ncbi:MAG: hypothetical protein ACYC3B_00245 [Sedimentisphaerales bacterium]